MKAAVSTLTGIAIAVIVALAAGFVGNGLTPGAAWLSLAAGGACGVFWWRVISRRDGVGVGMNGPQNFFPKWSEAWRGFQSWNWAQWGTVLIFTFYAWRAFSWVLYESKGQLRFLSPVNFGDVSLHLTYIHFFANGAPFWPANPIFAGEPLRYPIGVDLFTSLLVMAGMDSPQAFAWLGLLACIATGIALWHWGGAFAMAGFLFIGGTAGFAFFHTWEFKDYLAEADWKSIPLALFVTQRSLLFAIPAGLVLLVGWRSRFLHHKPILPLGLEVLLYASMPVFHMHTFLYLSLLLGVWVVMLPTRVQVLRILAFAFVPATGLVWFVTGGIHSGKSMIHWQPGWMQDGQNPFNYWIYNFGFLPFCAVMLVGKLANTYFSSKTNAENKATAFEQSAFVFPALLMFLLTCFISFAPWEWDNTKLMIWSILTILPALWLLIRQLPLYLRASICLALFFSGFISLYAGLGRSQTGYDLISIEERETLNRSLNGIPVTATFAGNPTFDNPILLLGHKLVCGYDGHLMSHGINYTETKSDVEALLRGESNWKQLIRKLNVDYIYWGNAEAEKFPDSTKPWAEAASAVVSNKWGSIYDVRNLKE